MQQQRSGVMQRRDCAPERASSGKSVRGTLCFEIRQARTRGVQAVSAQTRLGPLRASPRRSAPTSHGTGPRAPRRPAMAALGAPLCSHSEPPWQHVALLCHYLLRCDLSTVGNPPSNWVPAALARTRLPNMPEMSLGPQPGRLAASHASERILPKKGWVCRLASHVQPLAAPGHFGTCGARRPQKSLLVKHHGSGRPQPSVNRFLQLRGPEAAGDSLAAPSVDEFAPLVQRSRRSEV